MKKISLFLLTIVSINANEVNSYPSYQGFQGVINTPNSEVLQEGEFEFLYNNQTENITPSLTTDFRDNKEQKNFFLNMGVLPNLDLNLQYAYGFDDIANQKHLSNRIVNVKYQIPFIPKNIFKMAIGIQDVGGGNPYVGNKYAVISKELHKFRGNLGYAKGDTVGSIDGVFGSLEYQVLPWVQLAGEYDTREWNGAIKSEIPLEFNKQKFNLGVMAKSSLDYDDVYVGVYGNILFNRKNDLHQEPIKFFPNETPSIESFKLSNISSAIKGDTLYFSYENTLYVYNDIDALGMVLGSLATTTKAKNIIVSIKKSNIVQYTLKIDTEAYKNFLKDGQITPSLLTFVTNKTDQNQLNNNYSDRFRPTLSLQPDFVLIDGGEYSDVMDYTLAMQTELSMRLAKGTIISGRYNVPLTMTDNFKDGGIFEYRNRNKTKSSLDQLLLTQYLKPISTYPWINVLQVGRFDEKLEGVSLESGLSDLSGKHHLQLKLAQLEDGFTNNLDRYSNDTREEKLLSYRYYLSNLNSNLKVTGGEFLYGDQGISFDFERYFSDVILGFNLSRTKHDTKGNNDLAKITLSIPFGAEKRFKTKYLDIQGGNLKYIKRKTLVSVGENSYALPHHIKQVDNSFTLENYYLNNDRFQPKYIKKNLNRLRNVFIKN